MALTLSYGQTATIKAVKSDGTLDTFDLGVRMGELVPQLTIPSIIDLVRNTSLPDIDSFANGRFFALAKGSSTVTYSKGQLQKDPRELTATSIQTEVTQLTPVEVVDKIGALDIDMETDKFEDALAKYGATWILQNRTESEIALFNEAALTAQEFQKKIIAETPTATTFKLGAHVESSDLNTPDDAYNALGGAIALCQKLGLPNAPTELDKNYKFGTGFNLVDAFAICTPAYLNLIMAKQGVFASEPGFEAFKNMGIKNLLGIDILAVNTLPEGVNFMIFTTGLQGALAYQLIGKGYQMILDKDPSFFTARRLDISKQYIMGIVHPQRIWMHTNTGVTITKSLLSKNVSRSIDNFELNSESSAQNSSNFEAAEKSALTKFKNMFGLKKDATEEDIKEAAKNNSKLEKKLKELEDAMQKELERNQNLSNELETYKKEQEQKNKPE